MKKHVLTKFICAAIVAAFGVGSAVAFGGCNAGDAHVEYALSDDGTYYIVSGVSGDREGLTSYEVPATYSAEEGGQALPVKEIGKEAFFRCTSLRNITIPDTVEIIGELAFAQCRMSSFTIPDSVREIRRGAFGMCEVLTEITIPDSVTVLERQAFYCCTSLEKAVVNAPITDLPAQAFYNSIVQHGGNIYTDTALETVYLPATLQKIDASALYGNFLNDIYFAGTKAQWRAIAFYEIVTEDGETVEKSVERNRVLNSGVKVTCSDGIYQDE